MAGIEQNDHVCMECGKRFVTGVLLLELGRVEATVCDACADRPGFDFAWLKHLSNWNRAANQKALKKKPDA